MTHRLILGGLLASGLALAIPLPAVALMFTAPPPAAALVSWQPVAELTVDLGPAQNNPATPRMGDHLTFESTIRNSGAEPIDGLIAWISLVQVNQGHEQPVDLEDWSAHKAIVLPSLAAGATVTTQWPMRLIQSGDYRVVVSAVSRTGKALTPSRFADFTVAPRPVVESSRVLPVALGVPALLVGGLLLRRRRA